MAVVWTEEMAKQFMANWVPDPLFPCSADAMMHTLLVQRKNGWWPTDWNKYAEDIQRDSQGRCRLQCANCSCRMLYDKLECVKADLATTNRRLRVSRDDNQKLRDELGCAKADLKSTAATLRFTASAVRQVHRVTLLLLVLFLLTAF